MRDRHQDSGRNQFKVIYYLLLLMSGRLGRGNRAFTESSKIPGGIAPSPGIFVIRCARPIREFSMPRVLVIDDQSGVRTMISLVLRINQFEIVEAATAAAALKSFEEGRFDLAIVDIFLQGANGSDLITTMRDRVPDLPVIAISGMTALDFLPKSPALADIVCLQKPFRPK